MAASPRFKVYSPAGDYIGSLKHAEDAAALVALRGEGGTVRLGHSQVLWREGKETQSAGESFDYAGGLILAREQALMTNLQAARQKRQVVACGGCDDCRDYGPDVHRFGAKP